MSSKAKNEITGKLSSRVMNMKFMKHAETVEQGKQEEDKVKKLAYRFIRMEIKGK